MLEVAEVHVLRHQVLKEGRSQREVAKKLGISRNTVSRYLDLEVIPGQRVEEGPRPRPARDACEERVQALLRERRWTRKQQPTSGRIAELLEEEGIVVSPRTVRRVMREQRRQEVEVGIPLDYRIGDLSEVDFFEVLVEVAGTEQKAWMLLVRLMYSGRDFAWLYDWQDQACFLDGLVRSFEYFGGVPDRILFDNLQAAVRRVLVGSERELNRRFAELVAHYVFTPCFARVRRGSDKGGVESRGKNVRLQHLSPIPSGSSLQEISEKLLARLERKLDRPRERGGRSIAELWEEERQVLDPLPPIRHDPGVLELVKVDRQARIRRKGARYSVPCGWKLLQVEAWLYADRVVIVNQGERVEHARVPGHRSSIWYPHYLPELARKPAAIEQVAHKLLPQLGEPYERLWRRLELLRGRREAARAFRSVAAAIVEHGHDAVTRAVWRALERDEDPLLAIQPRHAADPVTRLPPSLAQQRVEASSLAVYDGLLGGGR
jgi:transposase